MLAYTFRFWGALGQIQYAESYALATGTLLVANVFQLAGLYGAGRVQSVPNAPGRLVVAWTLVVLLLLGIGFATKTGYQTSRIWVGLWFIFGLLGLLIVRVLFQVLVRRWQSAGRLSNNIAVVGTDEQTRRFIERFVRAADPSVRLIGAFGDRAPAPTAGCLVGDTADLVRITRAGQVDQIVIASNAADAIQRWVKMFRDLPVDVALAPDIFGLPLVWQRTSVVGGALLVTVFERPLSGWGRLIKSTEDRLLAALILPLILPLLLLLAVLVRLDSPGPVLFRQKRYGLNNEVIEVLKFRTMYATAAQAGEGEVKQAVRGDPRVTRVGRFLRRTSLDELPQLFNVLRGEMSIVGPRPHAVAHNEQYARLIEAYFARHRVKPGITGWAQVNGLRGETMTLDLMERRIQYDLHYIEHWSLAFDLRILIRTVFVGFRHPNAY